MRRLDVHHYHENDIRLKSEVYDISGAGCALCMDESLLVLFPNTPHKSAKKSIAEIDSIAIANLLPLLTPLLLISFIINDVIYEL